LGLSSPVSPRFTIGTRFADGAGTIGQSSLTNAVVHEKGWEKGKNKRGRKNQPTLSEGGTRPARALLLPLEGGPPGGEGRLSLEEILRKKAGGGKYQSLSRNEKGEGIFGPCRRATGANLGGL